MTVYGYNDHFFSGKSGFYPIENLAFAIVPLYRGYRTESQPAELKYECSQGGADCDPVAVRSCSSIPEEGSAVRVPARVSGAGRRSHPVGGWRAGVYIYHIVV